MIGQPEGSISIADCAYFVLFRHFQRRLLIPGFDGACVLLSFA